MRLTYDPDAKAAYLYTGREFVGGIESYPSKDDEDIVFDRDINGDLFGIEILNVELELLEDDQHVVEFSKTGYGLKHPLSCRPDLLSCRFNKYLAEQDEPLEQPGTYKMIWVTQKPEFWPK